MLTFFKQFFEIRNFLKRGTGLGTYQTAIVANYVPIDAVTLNPAFFFRIPSGFNLIVTFTGMFRATIAGVYAEIAIMDGLIEQAGAKVLAAADWIPFSLTCIIAGDDGLHIVAPSFRVGNAAGFAQVANDPATDNSVPVATYVLMPSK